MTVTVIVMIIIGIIFILASFFVSEKFSKKETNVNLDLLTVNDEYEFSEREQQIIKRKIEDVIANQAKDILYETNDSLASMANEKTLALGDYAVAVCDEIEKNHKEVMFLYSMLDDKQKEIMKTVNDVDTFKSELNNIMKEMKESADSIKAQTDITTVPTDSQEENAQKEYFEEHNSIDDLDVQTDVNISEEDIFAEIDQEDVNFDEVLEDEFKETENSNDIILEMYRNGSSILDIAKQLGLGVGEVRLVIDLYQGV